jgi:hypothetical protein
MKEVSQIQLPPHESDIPAGSQCPNRMPDNIEEDVGLVTSECPPCGKRFVYSLKTSSWVPEEEFERSLRTNPPKMKGL